MKSLGNTLRVGLVASALSASLGAVACGGDDSDDDTTKPDTVSGCVDACTKDASTCRAGCEDGNCSAGCDSNFDACKAACDGE